MRVKKPQREYLIFCFFLAGVFFYGGCGIAGTPTSHEKKIPAEYDLAARRGDRKILVLVNQPVWLPSHVNLRYYLTEATNQNLVISAKIPSGNLVAYRKLSEFRSNQPNFSLLSPAEVGSALNAELVLSVMIEDYQLQEMAESTYYKGSLDVQAGLFDAATGERLWPKTVGSRSVKVGFEIGGPGRESAVKKLVATCAHCIVRYFYDCPKAKFKVFDEKSDIGWGGLKKISFLEVRNAYNPDHRQTGTGRS